MDKKLVSKILGRLLILELGFMLVPFILSFYYGESSQVKKSYFITMGILLSLGFLLNKLKTEDEKLTRQDSIATVSLAWFVMSFFAALPFYLSETLPNFIDAFFETISGFTTTGASIVVNVEAMPKSLIFWRSLTQYIGGMGILLFAVIILPKSTGGTTNLLRAESPGPIFGKLVSKTEVNAKILYGIYFIMTLITIVAFLFAGMGIFDAVIHAFGCAATGGFSSYNASLAHFNSETIYLISSISMILFGISFNAYYLLYLRKNLESFKAEETKYYLGFIIISLILIVINLKAKGFSHNIYEIFFTVSTTISSSGFVVVDFDTWPLFSKMVLLILMFVGGCSGSTAGGLKVSRILILVKAGIKELKLVLNPKRVITIEANEKRLTPDIISANQAYIIHYIMVYVIIMFVLSIEFEDFNTVFATTLACLNNVAPTFGMVGPTGNFAIFSNLSKVALSVSMVLGRLELYPIILVLSRDTWRRNS